MGKSTEYENVITELELKQGVCAVSLRIDMDALLRFMAERACESTNGKSVAFYGALQCVVQKDGARVTNPRRRELQGMAKIKMQALQDRVKTKVRGVPIESKPRVTPLSEPEVTPRKWPFPAKDKAA